MTTPVAESGASAQRKFNEAGVRDGFTTIDRCSTSGCYITFNAHCGSGDEPELTPSTKFDEAIIPALSAAFPRSPTHIAQRRSTYFSPFPLHFTTY
ncbi:hypothetical protein HYPSUDRAFT_49525 [Hypholoma sublateritium FD-334 SS-4]|uniref:Uncharacterized protein n=1 Tax=Hypholoma sublateritium (strain FD-334 SS-4) TaxID=945553 RepID=A0A0D2KH60_HYPSF|nr:hypothetical protein HYPSUDRAFT_49525 [Hypholoma sublateritium FD-334 SS-4]